MVLDLLKGSLLRLLTSELDELSAEQNALMHKAAFIGMTEKESKEYRERATRIAALVQRLETLSDDGGSARGRHYEQTAKKAARHG